MRLLDSRHFDVLGVGEVLMDLIAPNVSALSEASQFLCAPGGAPANVCAGAVRLGGTAAFAGAVGDDPFGSALGERLRMEGVDLEALRVVPQRTTVAFVAQDARGIPDFLFYRGSDAELRPEDIPNRLIARSSFVYVSSMALLTELSGSATLFAMEAAREAGVLVAVDPNLRPQSWPSLDDAREAIVPLLRAADVLKLNDEEARLLTDQPDLDRAASALDRDSMLLLVTQGADGCYWRWAGEEGHVTAPPARVRDATGAGDAFMAAILTELSRQEFAPDRFALLDRGALERMLRFACAAGTAACTADGAMMSLPTRFEVEALLQRTI
ncbi:MAG: carbohydrate kinase family protein [Chloroflexota bacterium]